MNNMRRGFTMIELIFVIVIIGILAGVAVPKLSATRDDAVVSKSVQEVQQAISEIGAYYTAHGKFGKWGDMTNVHVAGAPDQFATAKNEVTYKVGGIDDCVKFASNGDANITVTTASASKDNVCKKLVSRLDSGGIVKNNSTTYAFGGSAIEY